jgi:hypothetical protein
MGQVGHPDRVVLKHQFPWVLGTSRLQQHRRNHCTRIPVVRNFLRTPPIDHSARIYLKRLHINETSLIERFPTTDQLRERIGADKRRPGSFPASVILFILLILSETCVPNPYGKPDDRQQKGCNLFLWHFYSSSFQLL